VSDAEPLLPDDVATIVNPEAWAGRTEQLAVLLAATSRQPQGLKVVSDSGFPTPPGSPELAMVSDPEYWSSNQDALSDALVDSVTAPGTSRVASGAISEGVDRLTLTVEEAAASLGISRASAYEAVRRGEIPAIRIGRRILVPRAALERFLASALEEDPDHG